MESSDIQSNSSGWQMFVKISFAASILAMAAGIIFLPADTVIKAYFAICSLFLVNASITLSKTLRDDHEAQRLINRVNEAKTNRILNEYSE